MSSLKIFKQVNEMLKYRDSLDSSQSIGFVPTMGALHAGHQSLIKKSLGENKATIVSIYVNPTQFDDPNDLEKYPKQLESDIKLLEEAKIDALFLPDNTQMYPKGYNYSLTEEKFSGILCGKHRKGHFSGVLTIVLKLFNIVKPHKAYFGKKDFQQYYLIKEMVEDLFLKIDIVGCDTIRESSGLALSSRNLRLSLQQRELAAKIYKSLTEAKTIEDAKNYLKESGLELEYLEEHLGRRFAAARIGNIRLIDNVSV